MAIVYLPSRELRCVDRKPSRRHHRLEELSMQYLSAYDIARQAPRVVDWLGKHDITSATSLRHALGGSAYDDALQDHTIAVSVRLNVRNTRQDCRACKKVPRTRSLRRSAQHQMQRTTSRRRVHRPSVATQDARCVSSVSPQGNNSHRLEAGRQHVSARDHFAYHFALAMW